MDAEPDGERGGAAPLRDAVVAAGCAGIGGWIWVEASGYPTATDPARDPAVLPLVVACLLWLCALSIGARLLVGAVRARGGTGGAGSAETPRRDWSSIAAVALVATGVVVYIWGAFEVGYLTATSLFLAVMGIALGGRPTFGRAAPAVLAAVACAVAIWFGFVHLLGVRLPITWAL
ncbi:tripartite tricarboxylate transporter TctB family protein [Allosalinactinospora lopnorensis]|uniref:tripartite tricarboxylate transporter TctB family protein n=1 Tax=Allosalinactinospora lopnorensis TaxID=1352348 RepID=UPI000623C199|nr:tripartite tricarboxylate transporter TctB family protein [Allosalinactinospora lopnorensis]